MGNCRRVYWRYAANCIRYLKYRLLFVLCILVTVFVTTWTVGNDGRRNVKSELLTLHEVKVDDKYQPENFIHNRRDIEDEKNGPQRRMPVPVTNNQIIREHLPSEGFENKVHAKSHLTNEEFPNIAPEEQNNHKQQQVNQQQNILLHNNQAEERIDKNDNVLHFQETQHERVQQKGIHQQQLGVEAPTDMNQKREQALLPQLGDKSDDSPNFNMLFQNAKLQNNILQQQAHQQDIANHRQESKPQREHLNHNLSIPKRQQNLAVPQELQNNQQYIQQNIVVPQQQQNIGIPQQQQNIGIPQQQQNKAIPQQQQNIGIRQQQQNKAIPQQQQNIGLPQQQQNIGIPQQQQNKAIPQQQQNIGIPQQQQNKAIPQQQQNIGIPQQQQNKAIPQQQHYNQEDIKQNVIPDQQLEDKPKQQFLQRNQNVQPMMKDNPQLQPNIIKKQERRFIDLNPRPMKERLPVVINWSFIGPKREYNLTCANNRRCLLTPNREELFRHHAVGIIFYGTEFAADGLPLPRKRNHLWSVLHEESPKNNDWLFNAKGAMELFNLTATFKRESHYPFPAMWLQNPNELTSTEYVVPLERKNALRREGLAPVVFVHSDCSTPSDRSHYMRLLQKHLNIDSYGKCEHNKDFPKPDLTFERGMAPMTSPEYYKVIAKYKFAFAFENAVCDDYVTEKFWRPLRLGVVPIVFGSPRIKDLAPSNHSIIDIRDFRSVQEVAEFIKHLDAHDEEYKQYIDFKQTGIRNPVLKGFLEKRDWGVGKDYSTQFTGFKCFICEKVHKLQEEMATGRPITRYQGTHNQYGCPLPKLFNEQGQYVVEDNFWWQSYSYGHYYLKSLQHHIDTNNNADIMRIHKYASQLQKLDKKNNIKPDL